MFPSGTDEKNMILKGYSPRKRKSPSKLYTRQLLKLNQIKLGMGCSIKPKIKEVLRMSISKERNMFVAERFILEIVDEYGKHPVLSDMVLLGTHKHVDF